LVADIELVEVETNPGMSGDEKVKDDDGRDVMMILRRK